MGPAGIFEHFPAPTGQICNNLNINLKKKKKEVTTDFNSFNKVGNH